MSDFPPPTGEAPSAPEYTPTPQKSKTGLIVALVIGGVVVLGGCLCVPLGLGVLLPAFGSAREAAARLQSSSNLRGISQALILYADNDRRNTMPPVGSDWAGLLMDQGLIFEDMLYGPPQAPGAGSGTTVAYFYVPARTSTFVANQVLAYEHPDLFPDGGNIAYHDNHVEWVPEPEFSAIINNLTLEDGTPWAPHFGVVLD